jgi:hypothetical protein
MHFQLAGLLDLDRVQRLAVRLPLHDLAADLAGPGPFLFGPHVSTPVGCSARLGVHHSAPLLMCLTSANFVGVARERYYLAHTNQTYDTSFNFSHEAVQLPGPSRHLSRLPIDVDQRSSAKDRDPRWRKRLHILCQNYHVKVVRNTNSRVKSKRKGQ